MLLGNTGQEPAARLKEQRPELRMLYTPDTAKGRCCLYPHRVRAVYELLNKNRT
jgi:hypothetical protein